MEESDVTSMATGPLPVIVARVILTGVVQTPAAERRT